MKSGQFNTSIRNAIKFFTDTNLLESTVYDFSLPTNKHFNKAALTANKYTDLYETGLSLSHYNVQITDLSFFQFSYTSESDWALAYYPNPRISGDIDAFQDYQDLKKSFNDDEITDEEFSELASSFPANERIPRFRYEYSENQYKAVKHPSAHFHIGLFGNDRWCVSRKISPFTFALIITKHFYPETWWARSRFSMDEDEWNKDEAKLDCLDALLVKSLQDDGVSGELHAEEKLSFHFSALA
jgi:hypothetical protein